MKCISFLLGYYTYYRDNINKTTRLLFSLVDEMDTG